MGWLLTLLLLAGCVGSDFNLATKQEEYTMTSTQREVDMGRKIAVRVRKELPPVADEPLQQRVRAIGERIVAVCDRQELVYRFEAVHDDDANAFSLPGGYVFVNDGLVKKTANDDELAGIIAHEVAHITARHAVKRYESAVGLQILQLATLAARDMRAVQGVGIAAQAAQLAHSRDEELEADRLGARYMKAAGFDPTAMLAFLKTLQTLDREHLRYLPRGIVRPQYALTHPFIPERIRAVKETLYGVADYVDYLNTPK